MMDICDPAAQLLLLWLRQSLSVFPLAGQGSPPCDAYERCLIYLARMAELKRGLEEATPPTEHKWHHPVGDEPSPPSEDTTLWRHNGEADLYWKSGPSTGDQNGPQDLTASGWKTMANGLVPPSDQMRSNVHQNIIINIQEVQGQQGVSLPVDQATCIEGLNLSNGVVSNASFVPIQQSLASAGGHDQSTLDVNNALDAIIMDTTVDNLNSKLSPVSSAGSNSSSYDSESSCSASDPSPIQAVYGSDDLGRPSVLVMASSMLSAAEKCDQPSSSSALLSQHQVGPLPLPTQRISNGLAKRRSRDERTLVSLGVPYSAETIINCSMDEFNNILANSNMREDQINTCRDIRRRGKNKIAAQNCRKRKVEQIASLAEEVETVRERKAAILAERAELEHEVKQWINRLNKLEDYILGALGRDRSTCKLELMCNEQYIELVESK